MKKSELIELGIAEDVAEKVIIMHGKDIESHKGKLETAKTDAEGLKTEIEGLKNQLTEAGAAIESFKAMKPEELKAAADDYRAKFEQAQKDAAAQVAKVKRDHALERELLNTYRVKPDEVKSIMLQLRDDGLLYDEKAETFTGLKEQVDPMKEKRGYLFADDKPVPQLVAGTQPKTTVLGDPAISAARKAAGLSAAP